MQMPAFLANLTDAQWSAIRYAITTLGVLLAAFGVVDQTIWDQVVAALLAIASAVWGIQSTSQMAAQRDAAVANLTLIQDELQAAKAVVPPSE